ncbi:hypothetical protein [Streptomyces sp. NPDC127020]|uniref:hypothetical protein n=1 Tax=Streptomyces sp. NPDC127020 TaxID=3347109 RepID=UPI003647F3DD
MGVEVIRVDAAVWGAVGAVLGAAVTAVAAYLGPARAARIAVEHQARERRERRAHEEIDRLIALRRTYRDWDEYLRSVYSGARLGGAVPSEDAVRERVDELRTAVRKASDEQMRDGVWRSSEFVWLEKASEAVLRLVAAPDEEGLVTVVGVTLERARQVRQRLYDEILHRLAEIASDALDGPGDPSPYATRRRLR